MLLDYSHKLAPPLLPWLPGKEAKERCNCTPDPRPLRHLSLIHQARAHQADQMFGALWGTCSRALLKNEAARSGVAVVKRRTATFRLPGKDHSAANKWVKRIILTIVFPSVILAAVKLTTSMRKVRRLLAVEQLAVAPTFVL